MRIDAHVHFWGPAELERYEWMTAEMNAIRRRFSPEDLRPHLERRRRASSMVRAARARNRAA